MAVTDEPTLFDRISMVLRPKVAERALFISERFGYVFVSNQKAACSTVKIVLYRAELDDPTYTPLSVHNRALNPIARPSDIPASRLNALLGGKAFRFTFVRNPYTRLLSVYRDKLEGLATDRLQDPSGVLAPPYRDQLARHFQIDRDAIGSLSFGDFVGLIEEEEPSHMDAHWRPQVINTCRHILEYEFVGRVESFDRDMEMVADRLGLNYEPQPRYNRTGAGDVVEMYYTQELAERVYAKFKPDFVEFRYAADLPV